MATITVYLTYQTPNLMWRNNPSDPWKIMDVTSTTAQTTAGDTVVWKLDDDTIKKIKNIKVGKKTKISSGYKWKDIWSTKPKKDSDSQFSGTVSTAMRRGEADGYDISVQIKDGADVTVDPEVIVNDPAG
jgi:hypothetical protein